MISFPPCKINLGLSVIAKRQDGYHEIETCFYPIPWSDILEIIPSDQFEFTSTGIAIPGKKEENLCVKAYQLLKSEFDLKPVKIHLHKIIPMGAGLGGGSSDAAHTLRLLNTVFDLQITRDKLLQYASQLGSDCSFFIEDMPKLGTGRGELLETVELSLRGKFIVIVIPAIHISTAEAYAGVKPAKSPSIKNIIVREGLSEWKDLLKNDFEDSVFRNHPETQAIRQKLYQHNAVYASMSGSGSAVYGIFDHPVDLSNQFDQAIYWGGSLN